MVLAELPVSLIEGSYSQQKSGGSEKKDRQHWGAAGNEKVGASLSFDETENEGEASGQPPSVVFHGSDVGFQHQEGKRAHEIEPCGSDTFKKPEQ